MGISHVRPVSYPVDASAVLTHHCVADVGKFAVLKDQEVCGAKELSYV